MNDAKHTKCDCDFIWGYGIGQHEIKGIKYCSLHSAAPDLLEACEATLPWIGKMIADGAHMNSVAPNACVGAMQRLEAAIRKAEGRS